MKVGKRAMTKIFFMLMISIILLVACRGTTDMYQTANRRISASEAREKMLANPNAIILDVRTAQEFETGNIPGAVLLPDYAIAERAKYVLPNKNALILVYCRSGARSREAAYELLSMGYTNVFDFGGIINWPYEKE
jgi:rhodanese-related sulfurtransferase